MNSYPRKIILAISVCIILAILACQLPQSAASTVTSQPPTLLSTPTGPSTSLPTAPADTSTPTPRPTSPPRVAEQRIAIHSIYGIAEFYDRETSQRFIPRGVNYAILVPILDHYEDRLFGTGIYDHNRTEADFKTLATAGYNSVRIILDGCSSGSGCIGIENGRGLNPAYLDNITDLMNVARDNHLFLLMVSQGMPELGGYKTLANQDASGAFATGPNAEYLTPAGIHAARQYWSDLLGGLAERQAPFEVILGWELLSEQYYEQDKPPFSLKIGAVSPGNGKSYTMSNPVHRKALAVEGMRYYIDQLRHVVLTYTPTGLISMGFFAPDTPNSWQVEADQYVETADLLTSSALDFFDLHGSPGSGLTIVEMAQNFGLNEHVSKPVLMGSAGASTWEYPELSAGAIAVQDWIAGSCSQGYSGWFYSSYYPSPAGLADATWGLVDNQNSLLNGLSPLSQPDACSTTVLPGRNLALGKPVDVSEALPDQAAGMAVDGDPNTQWSAGAYPPQWIEIDLGASYSIGEIRLTIGQWPTGEVIHQVWVGASQDAMKQVYEFAGKEYDYDILEYVPAAVLPDVRYVRIITTESPSWVSWREIEVLAPFPATPTPIPVATTTASP